MSANTLKVRSFGTRKDIPLKEMFDKNLTTRYRIGCDSLNIKNKTVFITTIVGFHPNRRGAFIYYIKDISPLIKDTAKRLWMEVEKAIGLANIVKERHSIQVEAIDFDLNTKEKYVSSRFATSAISYASSYGFKAFCKPDTLLAIYAADFISHRKTLKKEK
jgi:predicted RNase H-related nuclease YkuK (DUF458 family)